MKMSPRSQMKLYALLAALLILIPGGLAVFLLLAPALPSMDLSWLKWMVWIPAMLFIIALLWSGAVIIRHYQKTNEESGSGKPKPATADPAEPTAKTKGKESKAPSPRDEAESTFGAAIKWILLIVTGLVLPYIVFWLPLKMILNKKWNWFVKGLAYVILLAIGFNAVGLTWKYWPEVKVWLATHDLVLKRTDITRTERSIWFYQKTFNPSTRYELPQVAPATVVQIVEWNDQIVHFRVSWRTTMGGDKTSDFRWDKLTQAMGEWVIYPEGANRGKWHMKADGPGRFVGSEQDTAGIWHSFKLWRKSETLSMVQ